jgi:hypothetical protein
MPITHRFGKRIPLPSARLAPDITASIVSGRHDPDLTVSRLMADTRFPLDWNDQRRSFASA